MRSKVIGGALALALATVGASWLPAADAQSGNTFTVEKVVVGPVPAGAVFEVTVQCEGSATSAPEGFAGGTVQFDETGAPLNDNTFNVGFFETCTAEETVTNGASVSYSCEVSQTADSPGEGDSQLECVDDQTVFFGDVALANGTITVTNSFEETPPPPPDVDPDDVEPEVVVASPSFTG
ncbi:MAG TPA: hypothetical protein VD926_12700 [Acidimicrobiales bacterium]|nr:hypothetical protein [Acidimicrobiales bacterium]